MSRKSVRQLEGELADKAHRKQITEQEAAEQLALAAQGGITLAAARELIRDPQKFDGEKYGGEGHS